MSTVTRDRAWCVVVPHHARGARQARHRLLTDLGDLLSPEMLADTEAVLAELVGNAVRHARPLPGGVVRVAWRLHRVDGVALAVQVRVTDGGASQLPRPRIADPDSSSGRGLAIVAAIAVRWGVDHDGLGQSVWAELRQAPPVRAA